MLANLLVGFLGTLLFLFIFWTKLKEDYASEIIFKTAFNILLGILVGLLLAIKLPFWFLWISTLGAGIGLAVSVQRYKVRNYETLEASVISLLPFLALLFLKDSVLTSSLVSFIAFLATLVFISLYYYLDLHYKKFTWYKSGKVGFTGLAILGLIFLTRSLIALSRTPVLSFVGKYEAVVSGVAAFVCFLLIFNLSRQKI
jgi:hypothetical protein